MPQEKLNGGNGEKKIFKAAVVDADQLVAGQARDIGDAKMSESKDQLGQNRITKFARRIWQQNLMEGYYRNKEIQKARKDIIENKNLYHGEAEIANQAQNTNLHKEAMDAIVERFTSEYENEMLREEERDSRKNAGAALNTALKDLIKTYAATPTMDKAAFEEEKKRIIRTHNPEYAKEESLYADNLFDIANEVKQAVAQGEKLDQMDFEVNLTFGKARESLNTEGKKTTLDKLFGDNKFGKAISQNAILSGAVAGAYSITKSLTMNYGKRAAKWFGFGAGLAAGAVVEGVKENARVNRERSQNMRENAKGMKFTDPDMERREEMAKNLYETKNATAIISELDGDLSLMKAGNVSEADMQAAFGRIAELEARIRLGDTQKIDLISYDHYGSVEKDRMKIALRLAEIKVAIRKETASNPKAFMNGASYDDFIEGRTAHQVSVFEGGDIAKKDKIFRNLKRWRIARKMGQTMLMGAATSFAVQELWALGTSRDGVIEGGAKSIYNHFSDESNHGADLHKNATALEALRRNLFGESPRMPTEHMHEAIMGATHIELPDGADIIDNGNGTYDFVRDGVVISNDIPLSFDSNGNLSPESIALLNKDDIYTDFYKIHDPEGKIDGNGAKNPSEWVEQHKDSMHRIHRHFMGNDTPMVDNPDYPGDPRHRFGSDLNELRADWGGVNNTGVTENGDYAFNVHRMTDDGSFQGDASVEAHKQMLGGNLKMLLSVSKDSQQYVFEVDVDKYGNAIVDKNSEIGKMLFTTDASGHAVYTGAYAEIAHMNADVTYPDGGQDMDILATHIGDDAANIPHDDVPYVTFDLPDDTDYDPPYPIPIVPRRPLERGEYGKSKPTPQDKKMYPIYYGMNNPDGLMKEMKKAGFKPDPYFEKMIDGKKVFVDKDGNLVKRSLERERARVKEYLQMQNKEYLKELNAFANSLPPMQDECRVTVNIPARFEEKNLANLLDQYSKQVDKSGKLIDKKLFEINIIVNKKEGEKADNSLSVIEEWKKMNPGYQVNTIDKTFAKEDANVGNARKYITDLALIRSIARKNPVGELYIESEDADLMAVDKRTIDKLITTFDEKPYLDVLRGIQDRQPEIMSKNDLLFFERRLWDMMEPLMRKEAYRPENMKGSSFAWNRVISGGWNTAYTAESYVQIGGYVPDLIGEDMKIGQKISLLRGDKNNEGEQIPNTKTAEMSGLRSNSSPRRFIDAMAKNVSPYDDFENQSLKEKTIDELLDTVKEYSSASVLQKSKYEQSVNTLLSFVREQMGPNSAEAEAVIKKTMFMMGLKENTHFTMGDGKISFNDASMPRVIELLTKYKDQKRYLWGYRRQNNNIVKKLVPKKELTPDSIEVKKVEKMSAKELGDEYKKTLASILKKEGKIEIDKFNFGVEDGHIVSHINLKALDEKGGKPTVDLDIVSKGNDFVFNKTNNKVRANSTSRGSVNEALVGLSAAVKVKLEKKYKQNISKISIEGGEIKLTFE